MNARFTRRQAHADICMRSLSFSVERVRACTRVCRSPLVEGSEVLQQCRGPDARWCDSGTSANRRCACGSRAQRWGRGSTRGAAAVLAMPSRHEQASSAWDPSVDQSSRLGCLQFPCRGPGLETLRAMACQVISRDFDEQQGSRGHGDVRSYGTQAATKEALGTTDIRPRQQRRLGGGGLRRSRPRRNGCESRSQCGSLSCAATRLGLSRKLQHKLARHVLVRSASSIVSVYVTAPEAHVHQPQLIPSATAKHPFGNCLLVRYAERGCVHDEQSGDWPRDVEHADLLVSTAVGSGPERRPPVLHHRCERRHQTPLSGLLWSGVVLRGAWIDLRSRRAVITDHEHRFKGDGMPTSV